MLKRLLNSASVQFTISPVDPLLIKSGQATVGGSDMSFVRTRGVNGTDAPFIPGSSLKGVVRSYSEKICRSLKAAPVPVCLPYLDPRNEQAGEKGQASCGLRFEKFKKDSPGKSLSTQDAYRHSCPVCRLFGSHVFTGRYKSADAYLKPGSSAVFEIRDGVAIDRFTGGVASGAKYDLEVLVKGDFTTTIEIQNFERWQLGLLGLVLRDMEQELVRIGSGTSRGLGRIKAEISSFQIGYFGKSNGALVGLASQCTEEEKTAYGFFKETSIANLPTSQISGLRHVHDITASWKDTLSPAVDDLVAYLDSLHWPGSLNEFVNRR